MHKNTVVVMAIVASLFCIISRAVSAQSPAVDEHRFEIGGQFSGLNNPLARDVTVTAVQCVTTPCPTIITVSRSQEIQPGFGGRLGYNFNRNFALEAEVNFFPGTDSFSQPEAFNDGNTIEGLFGLKAGKRFRKIGVFGKARPGFLYVSKGDLQPIPNTGCIAAFPPPAACFETKGTNSFAFDFGGVVEVYPTRRTLIRFDVGDTIVRLAERSVSGILNPAAGLSPSSLVVVRVPGETTHNLQVSAGIGFRF